jgi:hypothetical protein
MYIGDFKLGTKKRVNTSLVEIKEGILKKWKSINKDTERAMKHSHVHLGYRVFSVL